jgi:hypothetical protein
MVRTRGSTNSTTPAKVIDYGSITLNGSINGEVTPIPGVGDVFILEHLNCHLDRIHG